jgi:hypothetical protein
MGTLAAVAVEVVAEVVPSLLPVGENLGYSPLSRWFATFTEHM